MTKTLVVAVAAAAVVAMTATADAKSKKRHANMQAAGSGMMMQGGQNWGGNWNGSYYAFKGDRYDFSMSYTKADSARRADAALKR